MDSVYVLVLIREGKRLRWSWNTLFEILQYWSKSPIINYIIPKIVNNTCQQHLPPQDQKTRVSFWRVLAPFSCSICRTASRASGNKIGHHWICLCGTVYGHPGVGLGHTFFRTLRACTAEECSALASRLQGWGGIQVQRQTRLGWKGGWWWRFRLVCTSALIVAQNSTYHLKR